MRAQKMLQKQRAMLKKESSNEEMKIMDNGDVDTGPPTGAVQPSYCWSTLSGQQQNQQPQQQEGGSSSLLTKMDNDSLPAIQEAKEQEQQQLKSLE